MPDTPATEPWTTDNEPKEVRPGARVYDSGVYQATIGGTAVRTKRGPLRSTLVRGRRAPAIRGTGRDSRVRGLWVQVIDTQPRDGIRAPD